MDDSALGGAAGVYELLKHEDPSIFHTKYDIKDIRSQNPTDVLYMR